MSFLPSFQIPSILYSSQNQPLAQAEASAQPKATATATSRNAAADVDGTNSKNVNYNENRGMGDIAHKHDLSSKDDHLISIEHDFESTTVKAQDKGSKDPQNYPGSLEQADLSSLVQPNSLNQSGASQVADSKAPVRKSLVASLFGRNTQPVQAPEQPSSQLPATQSSNSQPIRDRLFGSRSPSPQEQPAINSGQQLSANPAKEVANNASSNPLVTAPQVSNSQPFRSRIFGSRSPSPQEPIINSVGQQATSNSSVPPAAANKTQASDVRSSITGGIMSSLFGNRKPSPKKIPQISEPQPNTANNLDQVPIPDEIPPQTDLKVGIAERQVAIDKSTDNRKDSEDIIQDKMVTNVNAELQSQYEEITNTVDQDKQSQPKNQNLTSPSRSAAKSPQQSPTALKTLTALNSDQTNEVPYVNPILSPSIKVISGSPSAKEPAKIESDEELVVIPSSLPNEENTALQQSSDDGGQANQQTNVEYTNNTSEENKLKQSIHLINDVHEEKPEGIDSQESSILEKQQVESRPKPLTEENPEATLVDICNRLRTISGVDSSQGNFRDIFTDLIVIFEGLEIQVRGKIVGLANADDFSEALAALGIFNFSLGPPIRESVLRKIFLMYSSGEEFVDYEVLCMQLIGSTDPRLLPGNRSDSDILSVFMNSISALFHQSMKSRSSTDAQQLLLDFYICGGDSSKDLLTVVPNYEQDKTLDNISQMNDNELLITWFCKLSVQACPSLRQEEAMRLYILLHSSSPIIRDDILKAIASSESNDELASNLTKYFDVSIPKTPASSLLRSLSQKSNSVRKNSRSDPLSVGDANKIDTCVLAMDIIRVLQFDPKDPNRTTRDKIAKRLEEEDAVFSSLREIRRKKALTEGRVGGDPIPSKPTPEIAAIKIQSSWRSKLTRRKLRLQNIAADVIQRAVRRIQAKRKARAQLNRLKKYTSEEKERVERQRRIWKQERELTLLRNLPVKDFLTYDKIKQHSSAKVLQKFWRGIASSTNNLNRKDKDLANQMLLRMSRDKSAQRDETSEEIDRLTELMLDRITSSKKSLLGFEAPKPVHEDALSEEQMKTIRLAALQRRVLEQANEKRNQREIIQANRGLRSDMNIKSAKLNDSLTPLRLSDYDDLENDENVSRGKLRRRKYEELIEMQNMSAVMMQEYTSKYKAMNDRKVERKKQFDRIKSLQDELSNLPPLDKSPIDKWIQTMSEREVNSNIVQEAVTRHVHISKAMKGLHSIGEGDRSKYRKWSIVASPYDTLLPPMDLTQFNKHEEFSSVSRKNKLLKGFDVRLADEWVNGSDVEDSMWWVAYSSQPPTYIGDGAIDNHVGDTEVDKSPEQHLVHQLVGHVDSNELLQRLCRETIGSNARPLLIDKAKKSEQERTNRLSQLYTDQALSKIYQERYKKRVEDQSSKKMKQMEKSAIMIQSFIRGYKCRQRIKQMIIEKRVVQALNTLVTELCKPELRGKLTLLGDKPSINQLGNILRNNIESLALNSVSKTNHKKNIETSNSRSILTSQSSEQISIPSTIHPVPSSKPSRQSSQKSVSILSPKSGVSYSLSAANSQESFIPSGPQVTYNDLQLQESYSGPSLTSPFRNLDNSNSGYISSPSASEVYSPNASGSKSGDALTDHLTPLKGENSSRSSLYQSEQSSSSKVKNFDVQAIMITVIQRVVEGSYLASRSIIKSALLSGEVYNFRKKEVFGLLKGLLVRCGGVSPLMAFLIRAVHAISRSTLKQPSYEADIHIVGVLLSELCIDLEFIRPRSTSSTSPSRKNQKNNSHSPIGQLASPAEYERTWQNDISQIGYFLSLLSAIDTIKENPVSRDLDESTPPTVDINSTLISILHDIWLDVRTADKSNLTVSITDAKRKALVNDISLCRTIIATKASRSNASRQQVMLACLPSSMRRLEDNYGISDDDIVGVFSRVGDIRIGQDECRYIRHYLIASEVTGKELYTSLGAFKAWLCSQPATLNHRLLQRKLQILLNASPQLIEDICSAFFSSYEAQHSLGGRGVDNQFIAAVQHALVRSNCLLCHAEVFALSQLLERGKATVNLDIMTSLTRIKNGQYLAAVLTA